MNEVRHVEARAALARVAQARLSWIDFAEEALDLLRRVVPFEAAVISPFDPKTGLIAGSIKIGLPDDAYPSFAHYEYRVEASDTFSAIATRDDPLALLSDETGGDKLASARYREFQSPVLGLEHEARLAGVIGGELWGGLAIHREPGPRDFDADEAELLRSFAPILAAGMRWGQASFKRMQRPAHGVAVVDELGRIVARTDDAAVLLKELDPSGRRAVPIPVVTAVVTARIGGTAEVRVQAPGRGWIRVRGSLLTDAAGGTRAVAVSLDTVAGDDAAVLTMAALGLSRREQEVVELVIDGASTAAIADRLHLSPYTVQDHLKAVFGKAEVRSRRELVARLTA